MNPATDRGKGVLLAALFAGFYACHLAPGVLWGEPARRALIVMGRDVSPFDGGNHALGTLVGIGFSLLPLDLALSQNLMSAVFGVLTLAALFRFLRDSGLSFVAAAGASAALGVSHTFWLMSVIAETYTLATFLLVGYLWACRRFLEDPSPVRALLVMLLPFACASHHMLFLLFPPVAFLSFAVMLPGIRRTWLLLHALLGALGSSWLLWGTGGRAFRHTVAVHFAYWFHPGIFLREAAGLANILAFQFPSPALVLGAAGFLFLWRRDRRWALFTGLLFAVLAAFASAYAVNRKFYLLVPAYLLLALFVAEGIEALRRRRNAWAWGIVCLSVAMPVGIYGIMSRHPAARALHPALSRGIPYRDAQRYLLWPGKRGEDGALRFAREMLSQAGDGGLILADYTVWAPLEYMRRVEGPASAEAFMTDNLGPGDPEVIRERLRGVIDPVLKAGRAVILATPESVRFLRDAPSGSHYEAFPWLEETYRVERAGHAWRLSGKGE